MNGTWLKNTSGHRPPEIVSQGVPTARAAHPNPEWVETNTSQRCTSASCSGTATVVRCPPAGWRSVVPGRRARCRSGIGCPRGARVAGVDRGRTRGCSRGGRPPDPDRPQAGSAGRRRRSSRRSRDHLGMGRLRAAKVIEVDQHTRRRPLGHPGSSWSRRGSWRAMSVAVPSIATAAGALRSGSGPGMFGVDEGCTVFLR